MNSKLDEKCLDSICAHWLLYEFGHSIQFAFVSNHCVVVSCQCHDVWLLDVMLVAQLEQLLTCLKAIHYRHTAIHENDFETVDIAFGLAAFADFFLEFINRFLATADCYSINFELYFNHGLHCL